MREPVAYVSTWRVKEGRFPDYERFYAALVAAVRANEPEVTAFLAFGDAAGTEITNVHVYADQAVLERHMRIIGEQMGLLPDELSAMTESLEPVRIQVLGAPSGTAAEMDRGLAEAGVPFELKPRFLGGFVR